MFMSGLSACCNPHLSRLGRLGVIPPGSPQPTNKSVFKSRCKKVGNLIQEGKLLACDIGGNLFFRSKDFPTSGGSAGETPSQTPSQPPAQSPGQSCPTAPVQPKNYNTFYSNCRKRGGTPDTITQSGCKPIYSCMLDSTRYYNTKTLPTKAKPSKKTPPPPEETPIEDEIPMEGRIPYGAEQPKSKSVFKSRCKKVGVLVEEGGKVACDINGNLYFRVKDFKSGGSSEESIPDAGADESSGLIPIGSEQPINKPKFKKRCKKVGLLIEEGKRVACQIDGELYFRLKNFPTVGGSTGGGGGSTGGGGGIPTSPSGKKMTPDRLNKWTRRCSEAGGEFLENYMCRLPNGQEVEPTLEWFNKYKKIIKQRQECLNKSGYEWDDLEAVCIPPVVGGPEPGPGPEEDGGGASDGTYPDINNCKELVDYVRSTYGISVSCQNPNEPANITKCMQLRNQLGIDIPCEELFIDVDGGTFGGDTTNNQGDTYNYGDDGIYYGGGGDGGTYFDQGDTDYGDEYNEEYVESGSGATEGPPYNECRYPFDGVNNVVYNDSYGPMEIKSVVCGELPVNQVEPSAAPGADYLGDDFGAAF